MTSIYKLPTFASYLNLVSNNVRFLAIGDIVILKLMMNRHCFYKILKGHVLKEFKCNNIILMVHQAEKAEISKRTTIPERHQKTVYK